jgi:antitoxin (DNA-binding transcriptional repressor) of toxin-antitoxin stability system
VQTLTMTQARAMLPTLLDRVADGEEITITRHGRPAAVVLRPDALRSRRADAAFEAAAEIRRRLDEARRLPRPPGGLTVERAEELVAEIQADRDGR